MTPRLPPVLDSTNLPLPELQCAALDGEVFPLDLVFCPIDEFETLHLRARALGTVIDSRIIAERMTAAWLWGAVSRPPRRHHLCVSIGARTRPPLGLQAMLREVVITEDDIATVAGVRITSRLRTVLDLARFCQSFDEREKAVVRTLMADENLDYAECVRSLEARRNLPQRRRALERLASVGNPNPTRSRASRY